ncbi:MAG: TetR/AcrR family transcriptional regulator [Actinomycetota bacterium]|nr:TetR/AcrR family transcriptional regulator [Actinomycetota bacterium]
MVEKNLLIRALECYGSADPGDRTSRRIVDAALRQFELFGINRSTVEQITRRAGLSRVTLYRRFPGKRQLIEAVMMRKLTGFLEDLEREIATYPTAEDKLTEGFVFALAALREDALLSRLLESEPETFVPYLTVQGAPVLQAAANFLATHLARDLDDDRTGTELLTVADLTVRLMISFVLTPHTTVDLDDPQTARAYAQKYLAPILTGGTPPTGAPTPDHPPDSRR